MQGRVCIYCIAPNVYCPTSTLPGTTHLLGQAPKKEGQRSAEEGTLTAGQLSQCQPQLQAGGNGGEEERALSQQGGSEG